MGKRESDLGQGLAAFREECLYPPSLLLHVTSPVQQGTKAVEDKQVVQLFEASLTGRLSWRGG